MRHQVGPRTGTVPEGTAQVGRNPRVHTNGRRLRELVYVAVAVINADQRFDLRLTRVPGLMEYVSFEEKVYRVVLVQHEPIDDDGFARLGWDALLEVELVPEADEFGYPRRRRTRRPSGKKPVGNPMKVKAVKPPGGA
jgi:hypothetical protein